MTTLRSIATLTLASGLLAGSAVGAQAAATVEGVDWVTLADASVIERGGVADVAFGPDAAAVMVGRGPEATHEHYDGRIWWSPDGSDWRRSELPNAYRAKPQRVIATQGGYVAIGWGKPKNPDKRGRGVIWTSTDGTEWSPQAFEGAQFNSLDSVGDRVVVAGEQGETQTVWTSRAGGPWQPATVAPEGSGFTAHQIALSADGVYLIRDFVTGQLYRSDDGMRFTSVDLPGDLQQGEDRRVDGLERVADGFALVAGQEDGSASSWLSADGRQWRPGDAVPGYAVGSLEMDRPAALWVADRADLEGNGPVDVYLGFLHRDGTWCAVSSPATVDQEIRRAFWSEDGRLVVIGSLGRYGDQIIWQASGVRCGAAAA